MDRVARPPNHGVSSPGAVTGRTVGLRKLAVSINNMESFYGSVIEVKQSPVSVIKLEFHYIYQG
jgi:hypothetical protein